MRNTKRRLELFAIYDRVGLERHLAKMAEKGWLLEKIGRFLWTYRRIEPKHLAFSVCYFPTASQFDPEPSEEQETFYDFCQHTGWVLAATKVQLQIFYNERPHPVPIETDPAEEVDTIHRAMRKSYVPSSLFLLGIGALNGGRALFSLKRDPIGTLSSVSSLFSCLCWSMVILLTVTDLVSYFRWHRKAEEAAEHGEFYSARSHRWFQFGGLVFLAVWLSYFFLSVLTSGDKTAMALLIATFLIYLPGAFLIVDGIKEGLKKKGVSKGVNRVVTLVGGFVLISALLGGITWGTLYGSRHGWFQADNEETYVWNGHTHTAYNDTLPVAVEDLTGDFYESYNRKLTRESSVLLTRIEVSQWRRLDAEDQREMPYLDYTVVVVKVPLLYEMCKEELYHARDGYEAEKPEKDRYSWQPVDPAPWGAVEAYQWGDSYGGLTHFLLCYQDRIVELELSYRYGQTISETGMALVGEKLGHGKL